MSRCTGGTVFKKLHTFTLTGCQIHNQRTTRLMTHAHTRPRHKTAKPESTSTFGNKTRWTDRLEFIRSPIDEGEGHGIPVYRVMNEDGDVIRPDQDPQLDKSTAVHMYLNMTLLEEMDNLIGEYFRSKRKGNIRFYMQTTGEEAVNIGAGAALDPEDLVYAQYREPGILLYRGFTLEGFMNQCYGNHADLGKGRQIPVHYGSREHNYVTVSSPLGTQVPQAAGSAYAFKLSGVSSSATGRGRCVACFFGDGAASEGDVAVGLNFAATLQCPVLFFCRNNGYATTTPTSEQYKGDGIASKGLAYGIATIRVDGNDVLAVYNAVQAARRHCIVHSKPALIEAMTYRAGAHSLQPAPPPSHRDEVEVQAWRTHQHPIRRMYNYLINKHWWSEGEEGAWREVARKKAVEAHHRAQHRLKPDPHQMFTDVYDVPPPHLQKQEQQMIEHTSKYAQHYPLSAHQPMHSSVKKNNKK